MLVDLDERATIMAALRHYQEHGYGDPLNRPDHLQEIADADGVMSSLDDQGIDERGRTPVA
jgi:hypothetical protein